MSEPRTWREPYEETADIYPGLCVHDGRVTGSITLGRSRLPLWAIIGTAVREGWRGVESEWGTAGGGVPEATGVDWGEDELVDFLYHLLEARGEFGRLLCVLADVDRRERGKPWHEVKKYRAAVIAQLRRCIDVLDPLEVDPR